MTPQTPAERTAALEERVKAIEGIIPQITSLVRFMDKHEEREKTLEKVQYDRHQENREKLEEINSKIAKRTLSATVMTLAWTAAGVIVAILALLVTVKVASHSELVNPFTSTIPQIYAGE